MQTTLADSIKNTELGREADAILRTCVHCGFCLATCPTYKLLGDERDSPRGRIYLIKQVLEGNAVSAKTQLHLDRCLTCRNCETTCPSGVKYGELVDAGRHLVDQQVERSTFQKLLRWALRFFLPHHGRIAPFVRLGQIARPLLPSPLRESVPPRQSQGSWPSPDRHPRKMLVLQGCVQRSMTPATNAAAARILDRLGIGLVRAQGAGCCGAVTYHLNEQAEALDFMRRNIDAWWPHVEQGAEKIVMTASGCGVTVRDYGHLLRHDPDYAEKAARVSELTADLSEVLADEDLSPLEPDSGGTKVAFHPPCTLQHGQKLDGVIESILERLGFTLTPIPDKHLCCGSSGTYSILQKDLSQHFLREKVRALESGNPDLVATANIGCQLHLQSGMGRQVHHWIELLDKVRT